MARTPQVENDGHWVRLDGDTAHVPDPLTDQVRQKEQLMGLRKREIACPHWSPPWQRRPHV